MFTAVGWRRSACREIVRWRAHDDGYLEVSKAQRATGKDLATANELLAFFRTWRLVRDAAEPEQTTSARRIEARLRSRRVACGFYDREAGVEYEPLTPWESLPEEIVCPDCGSAKSRFTKMR